MSQQGNKDTAVRYWWGMARDALRAAELALEAGLLHSAVNRAYYAAFYAATAALLKRNLTFKRHAGVRAALHRELIKPGVLPKDVGLLYDELFEDRQHGDYLVSIEFDRATVERRIAGAKRILKEIEKLLEEVKG